MITTSIKQKGRNNNDNLTLMARHLQRLNINDDRERVIQGELFGGHDVSIRSIADLVVRLSHDPKLGSRDSLEINRK
ncbi:hypothetical protein [Companilactobacillus nodensis]|uniref:Uncharacterized protein n=1 Tax=Companilactobacillus nodensis DSM 19682 = JCM 14932 = NBRC 107160 TaxID=1423775 RepID=A0A0R1K5V9_9LACO|nr:hypothetical protein [Companilactobacillus nodensis]KRK78632.1 hypothetical protein FD03_GL002408 [Companilactobacillus nodensis DSM 19682 = JCM 14932 = NBRC 107160]